MDRVAHQLASGVSAAGEGGSEEDQVHQGEGAAAEQVDTQPGRLQEFGTEESRRGENARDARA